MRRNHGIYLIQRNFGSLYAAVQGKNVRLITALKQISMKTITERGKSNILKT